MLQKWSFYLESSTYYIHELVALLVVTKISEKKSFEVHIGQTDQANDSELTILPDRRIDQQNKSPMLGRRGSVSCSEYLLQNYSGVWLLKCCNMYICGRAIPCIFGFQKVAPIWGSDDDKNEDLGLVFCKDQFSFIYSILFQCWRTVNWVVVPEFLQLPTPRIGKKPNMRWQAGMRAVGVRFLKQHMLLV